MPKLELYEGKICHLYLDTLNRVTIGVGHLVTNRNAVAGLKLYKTTASFQTAHNPEAAFTFRTTQPATLEEKFADFDRVAKASKGWGANKYRTDGFARLAMDRYDVETQRDQHLASFYAELTNIYRKSHGYPDDFDKLPVPIQIALFDMIFNLGAKKIVTVFVNFDKAVRAGDWKTAAVQSHRPQINAERNAHVRNLFLKADTDGKKTIPSGQTLLPGRLT